MIMIDPISLTAAGYIGGVILGRKIKKDHDERVDEERKDKEAVERRLKMNKSTDDRDLG